MIRYDPIRFYCDKFAAQLESMMIFDFDGVLLNSLDEVTVSAFNAVTGKLITLPGQLPAELSGLFKQNRFHFQPAGDVLPLMSWCLENYQSKPDKILTRSEYLTIIQEASTPLVDRTHHFYVARKRFIEKNLTKWLSLNRPYQPLWDKLIQLGGENIVILTNKNREAVINLCHYYGLRVRSENIYSGDNGTTKIKNLNDIFSRFKPGSVGFTDDSLLNLCDLDAHFNVDGKRLQVFFASWGFIGPDDIRQAQTFGYPVVNQADLIAILEKN